MIRKYFLPVIPLVLLVFLFEELVTFGLLPEYLFPKPSQVLADLFGESKDLWEAAALTGVESLVGFVASIVVGISVAFLLSTSRWIQDVFYPYAVFFQTVPIIAIAPLLVIWFGYGLPTVIASVFIVSVFPMIASTLTGLLSTEPALIDLFRLYGASERETVWKLKLPFALPSILTGARISSGLAVIGAIVGEFIAGGGLGGVIDAARSQQRLDRVFAAVGLASFLGLLFFGLINILTRFLLRNWHASVNTSNSYES